MIEQVSGFQQLFSQISGPGTTPASASRLSGASAENVADGMGQALENAIQNLDGQQKSADTGIDRLIAGEPVDMHRVMLQMEQSALNLSLAIQVRNKLVEAYQEIQRMQV